MNDGFNILEYLDLKPERLGRRRDELRFVPPRFGGNADGASDQNGMHTVIGRHLSFNANTSGIQIRQVRHIISSIETLRRYAADAQQEPGSGIVVKTVRPLSRKSVTTSYWQDSGWERRDGHLIGHYKAGERLFTGSIELIDSVIQPAKYHIYDPPAAILRGPHGLCFRSEGRSAGLRKYLIHFGEEPADIDSGIIQIERDLSAAIGAR